MNGRQAVFHRGDGGAVRGTVALLGVILSLHFYSPSKPLRNRWKGHNTYDKSHHCSFFFFPHSQKILFRNQKKFEGATPTWESFSPSRFIDLMVQIQNSQILIIDDRIRSESVGSHPWRLSNSSVYLNLWRALDAYVRFEGWRHLSRVLSIVPKSRDDDENFLTWCKWGNSKLKIPERRLCTPIFFRIFLWQDWDSKVELLRVPLSLLPLAEESSWEKKGF